MTRKRVAILVSGRGSNMAALIEAAKAPTIRPRSRSLSPTWRTRPALREREAAIATEIIDHKPFGKDREAFDRQLDAALEAHRIDIVCLAGFMRMLSAWFVARWAGRLINIHPSLLPAFKGLHTHERAIAAGAKEHGATVHFVVPELDSGPIIEQASVPVLPGDTPNSLAARVLEVEHHIYPRALKRLAEGRA